MTEGFVVVYWDASAILSALIQDQHSAAAQRWSDKSGLHLAATLSCAEVFAVLYRLQREKGIAEKVIREMSDTFEFGPWQKLNLQPEWYVMKDLAARWSLRGADLWHLACAAVLRKEIPELVLLTFDKRLGGAAEGEGLLATSTRLA